MTKKEEIGKRRLVVMMVMTGMMASAATPTITGVTAQQRYPWNGKVDISYTVTGDIAAEAKQEAVFTSLKVTATDGASGTTYTATRLTGDLSLEEGTHTFVWDMGAEGLSFKSSNVMFTVSCETTPATYCVVDLSAGASAASYPVTYLAEPPRGGFNVDEYKTTKLVLRRIEAGTFIMGEDQSNETHRVTLTKPFFCGLFEVTQKQYTLVAGENPSYSSGNTRPVERVSYNAIRGSSNGAKWPSSSAVDPSSFMGKLRARTGLNFDLPTEAQWEYACRAGTTTTYYWGDLMDDRYALYYGNASYYWGATPLVLPVGGMVPNAWGLYDMSGNVSEWCLDWKRYDFLEYGTDPQGSSSGEQGSLSGERRVIRGGDSWHSADACSSFYRSSCQPYYVDGTTIGFRLVRTLSK